MGTPMRPISRRRARTIAAAARKNGRVDVLVVTSLVAFAGGGRDVGTEATSTAALYVALVTVYALLLPVGRGLLAVAFAVYVYLYV